MFQVRRAASGSPMPRRRRCRRIARHDAPTAWSQRRARRSRGRGRLEARADEPPRARRSSSRSRRSSAAPPTSAAPSTPRAASCCSCATASRSSACARSPSTSRPRSGRRPRHRHPREVARHHPSGRARGVHRRSRLGGDRHGRGVRALRRARAATSAGIISAGGSGGTALATRGDAAPARRRAEGDGVDGGVGRRQALRRPVRHLHDVLGHRRRRASTGSRSRCSPTPRTRWPA